ncbi:MAG: pyrroline-5-carboxylate reductase [Proteobacteria bacterium]|nr:MAG: pyrroline-5-carboxylate reductase [Pseudomonadota bacterium]
MNSAQLSHQRTTLTFIGAGNMARSLIAGLIQDQSPLNIRVSDPDPQQLELVQRNYAEVLCSSDNNLAIHEADVVVLAVKPQLMRAVTEDLRELAQQQQPLFVSVAAGVRESSLNKWLGGNLPIVRCMPNTPALVQAGATGLYANALVTAEQRNLAERILRSVGITLWLQEEHLLDAVTAVSGSGPAYFFQVMEAMQVAGESLGLSAKDAHLLVVQTALGAAKLALDSKEHPAILRQRVTSKGGTTEAALNVLKQGGLPDLFQAALQAAAKRSEALSRLP